MCGSIPLRRPYRQVYHDLWYTVPPRKGGITYGQWTVHRRTVPPNRVPGVDQPDARRVSAAHPALRGGVPTAAGGMAPRGDTPHGPPMCRREDRPPADAG